MTATIRPDAHPADDDRSGDAAMHDIEDRLRASYPDVDTTVIHATVHESYRSFDGARVRTFVPLLAENVARRTLRARRITL